MHGVTRPSRFLLPTLLGVTLVTGCPGASGAQKGRPPKLPPLVAVGTVDVRDIPVEVRAPVDLRPLLTADVTSKVMGYLDAVLVDRGDRVKKGQLVALVRPSDLPDQLSAARATQAQAEANVTRTRLDLERTQALHAQGAVAQSQLDLATTLHQAAQSQLDAVKSQVAALGTRLGETRIVAPMDGVVSQRRLDPGALVGGGGNVPIVTVERQDVLRAFVPVPEREAGSIAVGQVAYLALDAVKGRRLEGKVVRLAPAFDVGSRTLDAEVHLPNEGNVLRPGMYGRGSVVVAVHEKATVIPITALQVSALGRHVFVVKGDKVERRAVDVGVDGDSWVEVTAGLKGGEEVVVAGLDQLADGAAVRPVRNVDPITGQPLAPPTARAKDDPVPAPSVR